MVRYDFASTAETGASAPVTDGNGKPQIDEEQ